MSKRKPTLQIRELPPDMWAALQQRAAEKGVSIHVVVRAALRMYLGFPIRDFIPDRDE